MNEKCPVHITSLHYLTNRKEHTRGQKQRKEEKSKSIVRGKGRENKQKRGGVHHNTAFQQLHKSPVNHQLALSALRMNTLSKSGGLKNSLTPLYRYFKAGFRFLGAGGHVNLTGILASSPVGVVENSSCSSPGLSPHSPRVRGGLVYIGFNGERSEIPAITHVALPSISSPLSTWWRFSWNPMIINTRAPASAPWPEKRSGDSKRRKVMGRE